MNYEYTTISGGGISLPLTALSKIQASQVIILAAKI